MKILLRVMSILPAAIALFLVGAVINAVFFAKGGARVWACVLYVAIAVVLFGVVAVMWRASDSSSAAGA
jgi:hypothetical protein